MNRHKYQDRIPSVFVAAKSDGILTPNGGWRGFWFLSTRRMELKHFNRSQQLRRGMVALLTQGECPGLN